MISKYFLIFSLLISSGAFAKGFLARGTYEGKTTAGQVIRFTFTTVDLGSTTTVITACTYPAICNQLGRVEVPNGMHLVSILDFLVTKETFDQGFGATFGAVGPRRVVYSYFNLFIRNPEDEEITFTEYEGAEKVTLKKLIP